MVDGAGRYLVVLARVDCWAIASNAAAAIVARAASGGGRNEATD